MKWSEIIFSAIESQSLYEFQLILHWGAPLLTYFACHEPTGKESVRIGICIDKTVVCIRVQGLRPMTNRVVSEGNMFGSSYLTDTHTDLIHCCEP